LIGNEFQNHESSEEPAEADSD